MRMRKNWWIGGGLGVLGLGCALSLIPVLAATNLESQIRRAERALSEGRAEDARPICDRLLANHATSLDSATFAHVRLLAARAAFATDDFSGGLAYVRPLLKQRDSRAQRWVVKQAEHLAIAHGRLAPAEQMLVAELQLDRRYLPALRLLTQILRAEGRWHLATQRCYEQLRRSQFTRGDLIFLISPELENSEQERVLQIQRRASSHPLVRFARLRRSPHREPSQWVESLQRLARKAPQCIELQASLGKALAATGQADRFRRWREQLPARAWSHPGIWYAAAIELSRQGRPRAAIRCCWESLRRQADQPPVYRLLVQLLEQQRDHRLPHYRRRAERLADLVATAGVLRESPGHLQSLRRAMTLCRDLGRYWEAAGWAVEMEACDPNDVTTRELQRTIRGHLADDLPVVVESYDPVLRCRLDSYPLPDWLAAPPETSPPPIRPVASP